MLPMVRAMSRGARRESCTSGTDSNMDEGVCCAVEKKESFTKVDLVHAVAEAAELKVKDATVAVEAVLDAVVNAVASGQKVSLVGFGVFEARTRAPRQGRNPQSPTQVVEIPARTVPAFKPGKAFKDKVEQA